MNPTRAFSRACLPCIDSNSSEVVSAGTILQQSVCIAELLLWEAGATAASSSSLSKPQKSRRASLVRVQ